MPAPHVPDAPAPLPQRDAVNRVRLRVRIPTDVLAALATSPQVAFTRRELIEEVWGPGWVGDERLVDVHIARVRRKLGDDLTDPVFIKTVRGVGYRMGTGR